MALPITHSEKLRFPILCNRHGRHSNSFLCDKCHWRTCTRCSNFCSECRFPLCALCCPVDHKPCWDCSKKKKKPMELYYSSSGNKVSSNNI